MSITSTNLTKAAGAAAAVGGAIFVAVQVNHPPMEVASVETTDWVLRSVAKAVMSALVLAGITGMYLRQHSRAGWLGLVGYLLFAVGYLTMLATEVIAATILPALAADQPVWVNDVVVAAAGGTATTDLGTLPVLFGLTGITYLLGGVTFGLALLRTGILARWASALLVLGAVGTAALAVLPESLNRPMAVPLGIALIGLGVSLWRTHGVSAVHAAPVGSPVPPMQLPVT